MIDLNNQSKLIKYRKDIDGLRGFTVILIILYNLNFHQHSESIYQGFFLGVDVFFVISGYLITNILIDQLNKKDFSFSEFYKRRIRRMLPSLFVVLIISTFTSYFLLVPIDIVDHAKSVIASIFFSSNFYFHITGDQLYQSEAAHLKPLLHTWSLSIEEQFYLLYPAILFLIFKFFKKKMFEIIVFFTFVSLIANYYFINSPSLTFYLSPFRAWEIGSGCIVALYNRNKKIDLYNNNQKIKKIFYELIFFVFLLSLLFYQKENHYLFQVTCVFSAALLIAINHNNQTISKYFFCSSLLVKIGIISYSVYLFQHFILAYIKTVNFLPLDNFENKILITLIIFFISILNYILIEKPCRYNLKLKSKYFICTFLIIIFVNLIFIYNKGFIKFFAIENTTLDNKYLQSIWQNKYKPNNYEKFSYLDDKKKILIIGNSYGWDVFNSLKISAEYSENFEFRFKHYAFIETLKSDLKNKNQKLIKNITNADVVLFSTRWRLDNAFINLEKSINFIKKINPYVEIVIQSEAPEFFNEKKKYKLKYMNFSRLDEFLVKYNRIPNQEDKKKLRKLYYLDYINNERVITINKKLRSIANNNNLKFIDSIKYFCDLQNKECYFFTEDNKKIYWDGVHMTEEGNKFFSNIFYKQDFLNINK